VIQRWRDVEHPGVGLGKLGEPGLERVDVGEFPRRQLKYSLLSAAAFLAFSLVGATGWIGFCARQGRLICTRAQRGPMPSTPVLQEEARPHSDPSGGRVQHREDPGGPDRGGRARGT